MDPWREIAGNLKDALEDITGIGVVVVGHLPELETWPDFLSMFTTDTEDGDLIQGWQIVEPLAGDSVRTTLSTLNGSVEDQFMFLIRGFRAMGEDTVSSQEDFRDLAWEVKKALDAKARFDLEDGDIIHAISYPAGGGTIMPGLFGDMEAWMSDFTKVVVVQRLVQEG